MSAAASRKAPWREDAAMLALSAGLLALGLGALFVDGPVSHVISGLRPGGDVRRELELIQQFGSVTTIALCAALMWRLDAGRLRRMLDWLLAAGITWAIVFALKISLGRPRPQYDEPGRFLGPLGTMVVHDQQVLKEGVMTRELDPARHAWEFWARDVSELWSMPSSHTALAVVAAVCLWKLYPRLWPVVFGLAGLVGLCRVLFRAHYPSDVLIGAGIALAVTEVVWAGHAGVRLLDAVWKRAIDRNVTPALPALMERERAREQAQA